MPSFGDITRVSIQWGYVQNVCSSSKTLINSLLRCVYVTVITSLEVETDGLNSAVFQLGWEKGGVQKNLGTI